MAIIEQCSKQRYITDIGFDIFDHLAGNDANTFLTGALLTTTLSEVEVVTRLSPSFETLLFISSILQFVSEEGRRIENTTAATTFDNPVFTLNQRSRRVYVQRYVHVVRELVRDCDNSYSMNCV